MGYINGYTALTEPLNTASVAKCLGANTLDVGSLCTSTLINKWSFHKPMGGNSPKELSIEEKYEMDGGYSNLEDMKAETLLGARNNYTDKNLDWERTLPTWYRLTDFIGYINQANNFSPSAVIGYTTDGFMTIDLTWDADVQKHLQSMKTTKGYPNIGVLVYGSDNSLYYAHIGRLSDNVNTCHIGLDAHLPQSTNTTLSFIPILVDNGIAGDLIKPFSEARLYTNDELENNGVSAGQHQYAPFSMLTLGSKPFQLKYKHYFLRLFDNISIDVAWESGFNNNSKQGRFSGDISIINDNVDKDITANITVENNSGNEGNRKLHTATNVAIKADGSYSCLQNGGFTNTSWSVHDDVDYARIAVSVELVVPKADGSSYTLARQLTFDAQSGQFPIYVRKSFSELI